MTIRTLCVFGTRPEAIKMAPLIKEISRNQHISNAVCLTGQHQEMLNPVLDLFGICPDFDLNVMSANQSLTELTAKVLKGLSLLFTSYKPDLVLVHGDTSSTLAAAMAAYFHRIPVAHVEAGLRTGNLYEPWPEEANRKLSGALSFLHFAPTLRARQNLLREGINRSHVYVTGNTVIDALFQMVEYLEKQPELSQSMEAQFPMLTKNRKMILITSHRRENFGQGFQRICKALMTIAKRFPEVDLVYPVHLNPNVQHPVKALLTGIKNIHLIAPVDYLPFIYLMKSAHLILTDSGGIQEEAPSLGKPVLVMRDVTERPEAIAAGTVVLVGTDEDKIVKKVSSLLENEQNYHSMSRAQNPYGDGEAAKRIAKIIMDNAEQIKEAALHPNLALTLPLRLAEEALL